MNKVMRFILIGLWVVQVSAASVQEPMQPQQDMCGRYYYPGDTHNHLSGIVSFLRKNAVTSLVNKVGALTAIVTGRKHNDTVLDEPAALTVVVPEPIQSKPDVYSHELVITWIGHASFLIQIGGFNILTDPIFGDVTFNDPVFGYPLFTITPRAWAPGIRLQDLPPIDCIVISHNHHDHTDEMSLKAIYAKNPGVKVYVPVGNGRRLKKWGFAESAVIENNWWENQILVKDGQELAIDCLPARHWSIYTNIFGYRKELWSSWMFGCAGKHIYFAGDTAYGEHFKQIRDKFLCIDVALMPIAPTHKEAENHKHMIDHVDARQAIEAFIDLQAHCFIPMHYGVFFRKPDTFVYPVNVLHEYWASRHTELVGKQLLLAQCGKLYRW